MKKYILIANRQKDIEYQYADFIYADNLEAILFSNTKKRIAIIKIIKLLKIRETNKFRSLLYNIVFDKTIKGQYKKENGEIPVFIVMARVYERYGDALVRYLRDNFSSCTLVIYLTDLVRNMRFSLSHAKEMFDYVCSFDEREANNYKMKFVLEPFSTKLLTNITNTNKNKYDVCFVGATKGRQEKIIKLFEYLSLQGLNCMFYITGLNKKNKVKVKGMNYNWLDFEEVLALAANSKCVVEIMQPGGYSATTRFSEAALLNKNLLTDCEALQKSKESFIYFLDEIENLPLHSIIDENNICNDKYIKMFSIETFVKTIDDYIS